MEPITSSGSAPVFRPTGSGQGGEASALLRDGRLLSAEVLSSSGDGTVLLAIGRHTIPAESELRLDAGTRFLVRVEEGADGVVLRVTDAPVDEEAALVNALRSAVGEDRPIGELLSELATSLRAPAAPPAASPALEDLARALGAQLVAPEGGAEALGNLLASSGLGHEALLAAVLAGRAPREMLERARGDLKGLLLRAEGALQGAGEEHGPLRTAIAHALAGLEAEQLLNLARERAGEPLVLSFPFPDGEGWATARLAVPSRREEQRASAGEEPAAVRVSLGLELSRLGAVRADFALAPGALAVRVLVTRPELACRIQAGFGALRARMGDGKRALELSVRVGSQAEAVLGFAPLDIRYLQEHHLMNVAG